MTKHSEETYDEDGKLLRVTLSAPSAEAAEAMCWNVNTSAGISDKQETVLVSDIPVGLTHLAKKVTRDTRPAVPGEAIEYHRYKFKSCEVAGLPECEAQAFVDAGSKVPEPSCTECHGLLYQELVLGERERAFLRRLILAIRKQRPDDELSVVATETAAAFAYPILVSDVEQAIDFLEELE